VTQIPLKLAYAITIHKSQGMSIDALEIDCNGIFANNQFYVAMSRATNHHNLKILNFKPNMIRSDFKTINFYKNLENKTIFS
jgi:ATP-dependent DNA helicase PIF1